MFGAPTLTVEMTQTPPAGQTFYDVVTSNAPAAPGSSQSQMNGSRATGPSTLHPSQQSVNNSSNSEHELEKEHEKDHMQEPTGARRKSSAPLDVLAQIRKSDTYHPIHWPAWKKWVITFVYCLLQVFVTLTSTTYVSVEFLIQEKFGGSTQVITLGQSMFIVGTAVGPAFLGPLSDIGGRKWVYVASIFLYAILNIGTALAYNLPMLIIFSFLIGLAGSTALSNVAGTIADLFGDSDGAGQPMALFVLSANFGPSLGSPIGEWIGDNPHMGWRWIYYINIIIGGAYALVLCFMPETLPRIVISRAAKGRNSIGVDQHEIDIALGSDNLKVLNEIRFVVTMALKIMLTEPIVIFLALYNGFAYGLLFLYLDGVFNVFVVNNHLSYIGASLTYLNFCVGKCRLFRCHLRHVHTNPFSRCHNNFPLRSLPNLPL